MGNKMNQMESHKDWRGFRRWFASKIFQSCWSCNVFTKTWFTPFALDVPPFCESWVKQVKKGCVDIPISSVFSCSLSESIENFSSPGFVLPA